MGVEVSGLKVYLCSISFRHQLVSYPELVHFAEETGFAGIELWGVHARALLRNDPLEVAQIVDKQRAKGLHISMLTDYIDWTAGENQVSLAIQKCNHLISMANTYGTNKIRLFAGNKPSAAASNQDWKRCVDIFKQLAQLAAGHDMYIVIETHPNTLTDTLQSTLRLLHEVNHEHIRINLDFLHLWETGCPPLVAYNQLKKWTVNYHFKNVTHMDKLEIFAPHNVYSPMGNMEGTAALADGLIDYRAVIDQLKSDQACVPLALEWFGEQPFSYLKTELSWIRSHTPTHSASRIGYAEIKGSLL
jgi:3-dehydroshikimate dehydratase